MISGSPGLPFKSEKQRKYLFAKEPAIAKKWTKKYGSKIKPKKGKRNNGRYDICRKDKKNY